MRDQIIIGITVLCFASITLADDFGTGANQFTIDFVTITANPGVTQSVNTSGDPVTTFTAGTGLSDYTDPGYNYRMGVFEITNNQWSKFEASLGIPVMGNPASAYDEDTYWVGTSVPTNEVSWYEAAQFANWLNTSTGHHAAYNFTGTPGTSDYAFALWSPTEADGGTNLYRHKDAFYFLPTEDEWVKAAYWNGVEIQTWATPSDAVPVQNVDANYDWEGPGPWTVGSGIEELNGTFDMMGNLQEWMESPRDDASYGAASVRGVRGGCYNLYGGIDILDSSIRNYTDPYHEEISFGFRVASEVPEPATMSLLALGGVAMLKRRS
jgi:formylglycine-generating enzyme required for sulfatase activity